MHEYLFCVWLYYSNIPLNAGGVVHQQGHSHSTQTRLTNSLYKSRAINLPLNTNAILSTFNPGVIIPSIPPLNQNKWLRECSSQAYSQSSPSVYGSLDQPKQAVACRPSLALLLASVSSREIHQVPLLPRAARSSRTWFLLNLDASAWCSTVVGFLRLALRSTKLVHWSFLVLARSRRHQ